MPVEGINGILNVESAALHAPQVGVANTNPQHILSVGSNLYVSGDSPDVLTVDGNVVCEGVKVGLIEITPSYDLEAVANVGNSTSNTIQFTNPGTGIVTTGNVTVGKTLTVDGIRITAAAEADVDLDAVVAAGSSTTRSIQLQGDIDSTGPHTGTLQIGTAIGANGGLGVAGNVHVGRGVYAQDLDVDGDAIIRGDLSVLGTTTTIDTDHLRVQDPIIELGKDNAGTGDLGLVMTRPSGSSNVAVIFDESESTLELGYTNGGASDTTITMDLAPLSVNVNGNLSVTSNVEVGTANLFVDTVSGRVGIGKTNPGATLDVVGDVEISSNLAVGGSKFTYDNTNTTVFTGTASANANEIGYLDMSTSSNGNNIHVKVYIKYGQGGGLGDAEYSFYIRPDGAASSLIYDYTNKSGLITPVVYRTNATDLWSGGTPGVVRFGYSIGAAQHVKWRVEVQQRSGNATFYPTNTGSAMVTTGLVQVTPAPYTRIDSNVAVGGDDLFVDTVSGRVGIGMTDPPSKLNVASTFDPASATDSAAFDKYTAVITNTISGDADDTEMGIAFGNFGTSVFPNNVRTPGAAITHERVDSWSKGKLHFKTKGNTDFNGNCSTRMTIDETGNVGVGTDDPQQKLEVHGNILLGQNDIDSFIHGGSRMAVSCDASVLIVSDSNDTSGAAPGGDIVFGSGSAINTNTTRDFTFAQAYPSDVPRNEHMRILGSNGNVGIGTTNPTEALQIYRNGTDPTYIWAIGNTSDRAGIVFSEDVSSKHAIIEYDGTGSGVGNYLAFYSGISTWTSKGTGLNFVPANGRVGINDTAPSYKLDVNGTISANNVSPSDDRIKYNEQGVSNALTLISQLNPQKYEKIMERPNPAEGTWIPTDEEWENVKEDYTYGDEYGFIAQDVRNIPELSFLVSGEETRTDTKTSTPEEYSNLTTEEQSTYTLSYVYDSNVITQEEYSNLSPEEQEVSVTQYTKQIETQTPLALNYQGLFVVAIGAIKELKAKNEALETRITALENA